MRRNLPWRFFLVAVVGWGGGGGSVVGTILGAFIERHRSGEWHLLGPAYPLMDSFSSFI